MRWFTGMLFLLLSFCLAAQEPEKALRLFAETHQQEKVVLLFSKPGYIAGEPIYFKAWVMAGQEPSFLSTNLYTELYDKEKKLLQKQLIPLLHGSGNGQFILPASLAEDVYYVRAYTQWMRNFDERFFYLQPLYLYNPASLQRLRPAPVQWKASVFAEGGSLLDDVPANVAVRLNSTGTLPARWTGQLLEQGSPQPVADLSVYNSQIGQVRFIPAAGKQYRIRVQDDAGNSEEVALPPVQSQGIALQAAVSKGRVRYGILFKGLPSGGAGHRLTATFQNEPVMTATVTRAISTVSGTFDASQLPPGLLQLTLFNEKDEPLLERLVFLKQDSLFSSRAALLTDTLSTAPRSRNRWTVAADTLDLATMLVQVTDATLPSPAGFAGSVFLTADLGTDIWQADWYLTAVTPEKMAALDALLLTEKWSRFSWNVLRQNRVPALRFTGDNYLQYTGTVRKGKKLVPQRDMTLVVQAIDSSLSFLQVKTDEAGTFTLDNLIFTDSIRVFYQPGKRKFFETEPEISFASGNRFAPFNGVLPPAAMVAGQRTATDTLPLAVQRAAAQRMAEMVLTEKSKMLEEVVVTARARDLTRELEQRLATGLFAGGNAIVFDLVNDNQFTALAYSNILEWLQGRVPGFTLQQQDGTLVPLLRNSPAQLFLDEVNITPDVLNSISSADVAMIKVFRTNFAGSFGGGSAIAIYTRRGGMPSANNTPTLPVSTLAGYARYVPPPMPDYSQPAATDAKDNRLVLHYNPLPGAGMAATAVPVVFYNNDMATRYRVLVAGFTTDGRLIYLDKWLP